MASSAKRIGASHVTPGGPIDWSSTAFVVI